MTLQDVVSISTAYLEQGVDMVNRLQGRYTLPVALGVIAVLGLVAIWRGRRKKLRLTKRGKKFMDTKERDKYVNTICEDAFLNALDNLVDDGLITEDEKTRRLERWGLKRNLPGLIKKKAKKLHPHFITALKASIRRRIYGGEHKPVELPADGKSKTLGEAIRTKTKPKAA